MAIEDSEKEAIGRELLRLIWGQGEMMRRRVANYRASGDFQELKEAVTLPQNRRDKVLNHISKVGSTFIDECLILAGGHVTQSELNTHSLNLCNYTQDLFDRYQDGFGESADDIATDIETNITGSRHPSGFSDGYLDLWGE